MKKSQVKLDHKYKAKVSGRVVTVVILGEHKYGGWLARNEETGRNIRIKSAARLREEVV